MNVMIAGGAGEFGASIAEHLSNSRHKVVALDLLLTGDSSRVKFGPLVKADAVDVGRVGRAFKEYDIDHVVHCAMIADRGDRVPEVYTQHMNTTMSLLMAAREARIPCTIFAPPGRTFEMLERIVADTRAAGTVDAEIISWSDENGLAKAQARLNSSSSSPKR